VWLDRLELDAILQMKLAGKVDLGPFNTERQGGGRGSTAVGGMACPRDASILVQIEHEQQRHVLIDICTECGGTLLDAGELLDLADFSVIERIKAALGRA
jgi:Zn-finger nucleic acid-binding protein